MTQSPPFDAKYFIAKFEAIPEDRWTVRRFKYQGQCCAFGHCGRGNGSNTPEADALARLFRERLRIDVVGINDDDYKERFPQDHPKQRILAALYQIQERTA